MNTTTKRYLISSAVTFATAFLISVGAQLAMTDITPETLGIGLVLSIGATASRAAMKALFESLLRGTDELE